MNFKEIVNYIIKKKMKKIKNYQDLYIQYNNFIQIVQQLQKNYQHDRRQLQPNNQQGFLWRNFSFQQRKSGKDLRVFVFGGLLMQVVCFSIFFKSYCGSLQIENDSFQIRVFTLCLIVFLLKFLLDFKCYFGNNRGFIQGY